MTPAEHAQGSTICGWEKYAFVWRGQLLRWMRPDYDGVLYPECQTWTCSVEKIRMAEDAKRRGELPDRTYGDKQQPNQ